MDKMFEVFGRFDNQDVYKIDLSNGGLSASVLTWGATLQDLSLDGHASPLVLGFHNLDDYIEHSPYFGATVGRFANRLDQGRFNIDGQAYQVDQNETSGNHLHGGISGISHRIWRVVDHGQSFVVLSILDQDGQSGYPGNCEITCRYELKDNGILEITFSSTTDKPTLSNIAHHSYFNLDGSDNIYDHQLQINATEYLPVTDDLIPTGEIKPVADTDFDFRTSRPIRTEAGFIEYDHNFCFHSKTGAQARDEHQHIVSLTSAVSGVSLDVYSAEPGVQFYTGFGVQSNADGLSGKPYQAGSGLCLETQIWPDAPNHEGFPSAVLNPGEALVQRTEYRFSKNNGS